MLFLKHAPNYPIAEFVEYLWLLSDHPPHSKERILPTGTLELVINLCQDEIGIYDDAGVRQRLSGTVVSGAYSRPFTIDTAAHALIMGVHFRPGGAAPFTRIAPSELADQQLSHRHFASLFRNEVGMTPKLFARVQRFQRTIAAAREGSLANWAALSSACGYYDQSHLIRDFAAFARTTPGEYLRQPCDQTKDHHVLLG